MNKFFATAAIVCSFVFVGCSQKDTDYWADLKIENSNGKTVDVKCPGTEGCSDLKDAIENKLQIKFYQPVTKSDKKQGLYQDKEIGDTVIENGKFDRLIYKKGDAATGTCWIMTYGPQTIRVTGTINGEPVNLKISRDDYCSNNQYLIWNLIFTTDPKSLEIYDLVE